MKKFNDDEDDDDDDDENDPYMSKIPLQLRELESFFGTS